MLYQIENVHGGDIYGNDIVYDFSSNISPAGIPDHVRQAMIDAVSHAECYPDPYCRKAVAAISKKEQISSDHILIGNGAAELIYSFCSALKPAKAFIPVPTFLEYETALKPAGTNIVHYRLLPEKDFSPDEDILNSIKREKPDVVFLCHPNNPTGKCYSENFLKLIIKLSEILSVYLFVDECFSDLSDNCFDISNHITENPHLIVLKALTKSYALAGIRAGYCLSSDKMLLKKMSETVQPWNVSSIAQAAIAAAYQEDDCLNNTRVLIQTERQWLRDSLCGLNFKVYDSCTNYLLFQAPTGLDEELMKRKILIRNCSNYPGLGPGWYRIAVRQHDENEILIRNLRQIMEDAA